MKRWLVHLPLLIGLASCSSPPKPPGIDASHRRPANDLLAVRLQTCSSELQDSRVLAAESTRAARTSAALAAWHEQAKAASAAAVQRAVLDPTKPPQRNTVVWIHFEHGSTALKLTAADAEHLAHEARSAPLIVLRGRTDGTVESAAENRIARGRAEFVRGLLIQAGVEQARIRTTWQTVGDPVADNGTAAGRAINRRVEIELYKARPEVVSLNDNAPQQGGE